MKKTLAVMLALALLITCFVGCVKTEPAAETPDGASGAAETPAKPESPAKSETPVDDTSAPSETKPETPAAAPAEAPAAPEAAKPESSKPSDGPAEAYGGGDDVIAREPTASADKGSIVYDEAALPVSKATEAGYESDCAPREVTIQPQAGLLTAGEWNDNENYDFFREVLNHNDWYGLMETWSLFPTDRFTVHVTDAQTQEPVGGAAVSLLSGDEVLARAVTDHYGNAYLYDNLDGNTQREKTGIEVSCGPNGSVLKQISDADDHAEVVISRAEPEEKVLDLMLVVDTTGSMGDELEYLKEELLDVIHRVANANSGMRIRLSVNFYRDNEDEYVVKSFAFTEDIQEALEVLRAQYSAGGGDTPEAVDAAFDDAVNGHEWENDSVKLIFFVLDAPPHNDRQGTPETMRACMEQAAAMGIRVIPVVSSGADTELEFVMRTAAAVTGGTYTFLTDDSGIGGAHLEPTIGDYEVEALNALMVRIINEYCAGKAGDTVNTESVWFYEPLDTAEASVRSALEKLADDDEIESCTILSVGYDENLTRINLESLVDSDLAKENGFSSTYLASHFAVVSATYDLIYNDSGRSMNENGVYKCIFHMTQDESTGLWCIWDYLTPYLMNE